MSLIDAMDIIGTIAFAVSGALVGIKNRLDLFGIFVLSLMTASGGGIIRDVILKNGLPTFFVEPKYLILVVLTFVFTCLLWMYLSHYIDKIMQLIHIFDAIGLGVFTVLAAYKAIQLNVTLIGVLFVAVLTGVGGGVIRDTFVNEVPLVFKTEIYALASLLGAAIFYICYGILNTVLDIYMSIVIIFVIRLLAMYYKLNLPVIESRGRQKLKG